VDVEPGGTAWEGKLRSAHPSVLRTEWPVEDARRGARGGDPLGRSPAGDRRSARRGRREVAGAGAAMISQCISWDSVHGAADATTSRHFEWRGPERRGPDRGRYDRATAFGPSVSNNRGESGPYCIIWPSDRLGTRRVCTTRKVIGMERHERLTLCMAGRDCRQSAPDHFGYLRRWSGAGAFGTKELAATMTMSAGETHQSQGLLTPTVLPSIGETVSDGNE
jgi:hypothetical protein